MEAPKREDVRRERWPIEDTSKKGKYEAVEKMGKEAQKRGGGGVEDSRGGSRRM